MKQVWNRLQLMIAQGVNTLVGADTVQVKVLDGEVLNNIKRAQPYGFSSRPKVGGQSYLLFPSGDRSYGVAIVCGDKRYQMDLQDGEVGLHDDIGHTVKMARSGIELNGGGHAVTIANSPQVIVNGGDVIADGISLQQHVHKTGPSQTSIPSPPRSGLTVHNPGGAGTGGASSGSPGTSTYFNKTIPGWALYDGISDTIMAYTRSRTSIAVEQIAFSAYYSTDYSGVISGTVTGVDPLLYRVDLYSTTDIDYLQASAVINPDLTWSANVIGAGMKTAKLVRLSDDAVVNTIYDGIGLVRSYQVPEADPAYPYLAARCFTYDQAISVIVASARNDYPLSLILINGLLKTFVKGRVKQAYTQANLVLGTTYKIETPGTVNWVLLGAANNLAGSVFTYNGVVPTGSGGIASNNNSAAYVYAGALVTGTSYIIKSIGTTEFDLVGAATNAVGVQFVATGPGYASVPFSVNHKTGLPPDIYVRNGATAWVLYALCFYASKFSNVSPVITAVYAAIDNIVDQLLPYKQSAVGPQQGLYRGGKGRYDPVTSAFDPTYLISWCSTEHNIDIYFALKLAGVVRLNTTYTGYANDVGAALIAKGWNVANGRFNQGITSTGPDEADALDCHTWGYLFLKAYGDNAKAEQAYAEIDLFKTVDVTKNIAGYRPYISSRGYPTVSTGVWGEGSLGAVLARIKHGDLVLAAKEISPLTKGVTEFGLPYSTIQDYINQLSDWPSIASTGWFHLAVNPNGFFGVTTDLTNAVRIIDVVDLHTYDFAQNPAVFLTISDAPTDVSWGFNYGATKIIESMDIFFNLTSANKHYSLMVLGG